MLEHSFSPNSGFGFNEGFAAFLHNLRSPKSGCSFIRACAIIRVGAPLLEHGPLLERGAPLLEHGPLLERVLLYKSMRHY